MNRVMKTIPYAGNGCPVPPPPVSLAGEHTGNLDVLERADYLYGPALNIDISDLKVFKGRPSAKKTQPLSEINKWRT